MEVCDLVQHTRDGIAAAETNGWKVGAQIVSAVVGIASAAVGAAVTGPPGVVLVAIAGTMLQGGLGVAIEAKGADSELGVLGRPARMVTAPRPALRMRLADADVDLTVEASDPARLAEAMVPLLLSQ